MHKNINSLTLYIYILYWHKSHLIKCFSELAKKNKKISYSEKRKAVLSQLLTDAVKNALGRTDYHVWLSWIATTDDDQLEISQNRFLTSRKNNAFKNRWTLAVIIILIMLLSKAICWAYCLPRSCLINSYSYGQDTT